MSPTKFLLTVTLGVTAGLAGLTAPASAAQSSASRCDTMLADLGSMQDSLERMEVAVEDVRARRRALVFEAQGLATTIAERRAQGVDEAEVQPLVDRRAELLTEIEKIEQRLATLEQQLAALVSGVETTERSYIACVEKSVD